MFRFEKILKMVLMYGVMGMQWATAQTMVTTVFEGEEAAHHRVVQVLRGTGSIEQIVAEGGDITPNDPNGLVANRSANGSLEQVLAGSTLVSQIVEQGEPVVLNDPDGLSLIIRVHSAGQPTTYIVEQGGEIDLNDPDGLTPRTVVIHTHEGEPSPQMIVEQNPEIDLNDPDGLMAAEANGATVHRGLYGNTQVIVVVMPPPESDASSATRIHIYKTHL